MFDPHRLLDQIENLVVEHGGDLGGWTNHQKDTLQLFDGRVTLKAHIDDPGPSGDLGALHAHVLTTLHEHDDEVLDACLFGWGSDPDASLAQVAMLWVTCVAGPIRSFLDDRPVCMTCQAGVEGGDPSKGYITGHYGFPPGLRVYVGPSVSRGFRDQTVQDRLDESRPWFRFAAQAASPRRVHIAKVTVVYRGEEGWHRHLEIDGHDASFHDPDWPAGIDGPDLGYLTRFAVFEFPQNSSEIPLRNELERTIRHFAQHYARFQSVDQLMENMVAQGFRPDLVEQVESISTIAFGRDLFEPLGVQYSPTIIRARQNGRIETDVPLLSIPAYTRARSLAGLLRETLSTEDFQSLCCYNAESHSILQALDAAGPNLDYSGIKLYPCVVPDFNVSDETMNTALAMLNTLVEQAQTARKQTSASRTTNKPWWKFW